MPDARLEDLIHALPKAELHLHLEGTLEPELLQRLAERNGIALPPSGQPEARRGCHYADLRDFLNLYYAGVAVLRTRQDFYDLTMAYLKRVHEDGARHVEVFFDPQSHTSRGVPFGDVVRGIRGALAEGERALGISWRLIMCFLRDASLSSAEVTLEAARPWRHVISGVGLDSAEAGHPPGEFAALFARRPRRRLSHVRPRRRGRTGSLRAARRWTRSGCAGSTTASPRPTTRRSSSACARERVPLTMCPLSNRELQVTPDLRRHPLKRLLDAGVPVTVSSDDPAYFCGYLADNYVAVAEALDLSAGDIAALARNSITASLLDEARQAELLREIDEVATSMSPS